MKKIIMFALVACFLAATIASRADTFAFRSIAGPLSNPSGTVVGHDGYVYVLVSSGSTKTILKIDPVTGASTQYADLSAYVNPHFLADADDGNMYCLDITGRSVLKIASGGVVSHLTGKVSPILDFADGTLATALFDNCEGIAVDRVHGYIYVTNDNSIRKIDVAKDSVTTIGGRSAAAPVGHVDGDSLTARFWSPTCLATDSFGNLYVADAGNYLIRKVTPDGNVSTLAGSGVGQYRDGTGTGASFNSLGSLAVDSAGNVWLAQTSGLLRKITPQGVVTTPMMTDNGVIRYLTTPQAIAVCPNGMLYVEDNQQGGNYATWTLRSLTQTGLATGSGTRFINISTRANVGTGQDILIAGFVVTGGTPKRVLIRAAGPTLSLFGVSSGYLADPMVTLYDGQSNPLGQNDNWSDDTALNAAFSQVQAFGFKAGSKDAAMIATLQPGSYSVEVSGADGGTGVALVEVYELPAQ